MIGKKSFVLYSDLKEVVDKLPAEDAGKLFKLILDYVNDEDPEPEGLLLEIAFEPIKQQLRRGHHWQEEQCWEVIICSKRTHVNKC